MVNFQVRKDMELMTCHVAAQKMQEEINEETGKQK